MSNRTKIPLEITSIQGDGFHCFINGKIGKIGLRLLLDTGASKTVLDKNFLNEHFKDLYLHSSEQLTTGLGASNIESHFADIKDLKLGDIKIKKYTAHILDLANVNETYRQINMPLIHGVIGCDLLLKHKGTINFRKKLLSLSEK